MNIKRLLIGVAMVIWTWPAMGQETTPDFDASQELQQLQRLLLSETNMDSIVSKVVENSYALKMTAAEVESLREEVKMEGKSWMRSFAVGVNLFGYNVTPSQANEANATQLSLLSNASVTLLISPYDIIGQKNRIKRARHRVAMQEMSLMDKRREVKIYIINKFLQYQEALEAYIINENNLLISEELKHVADEQFKKGIISNAAYNEILGGLMQNRLGMLKAESLAMKLKFEIELSMND